MDKLAGLFYGQGRYGIGPCASPSGNRTNSGFVLRTLKWLACFFIVLGVAETALAAGVSLTINTPAPAEKASGGTFTVKGTAQYNGNCGNQIKIYTGGGCTGGSSSWQGSNILCKSNSYSPTITMGVPASGACTVYYEVRDNIGGGQSGDAPRTNIVKFPQTITVTTAPPASKKGGESFPVAATASSGLPVSVTVSGNCSYTAPNVTMTKTTGTCTVTFSQAGNATWAAAPTTAPNPYTVTATGDAQTITVTTPAPASAAYNSTFNVAATTNAGRAVAITTSGSCSGGGSGSATILMTSGTGTCTIKYNQTDNTPPYAPAVEVTSSTTATKLPQAISFPEQSTPSRVFANGSTFAISPTATRGSPDSGNAISYSSLNTGVCTVSGTTVTMKGVGDCVLLADQAGNANYTAAPQQTSLVTLTKALQSITVTQSAPATRDNGQTFTVKAKAVPSNLPVHVEGVGICSGSGNSTDTAVTLTMTAAEGICTVVYTQDGDSNYEAADPVTEYVSAASGSGCLGEGTYTGLKLGSTGGYLGWACNGGEYVSPGSSISCSPSKWNLPWYLLFGANLPPGIGFKGHVLQTQYNPGKIFTIQLAPGATNEYNILNETDKTCIVSGNGIYESSGTRRGSNSSAGYLVAIQDSATMPSGAYCNYSHSLAKWKINNHGGYVTLSNMGYPSWPNAGCIGSDGFGLSRLVEYKAGDNYGHWGDTWVRNAAPSCSSPGAKLTCEGYTPPTPDHIRYEFDSNSAYICQAPEVTIKLCANPAPAIGSSGSCTSYGGYAVLRPVSSRGSWSGLTAAPLTGFTGSSSNIKLSHGTAGESVNLGYSNKSLNLADNALECYDTYTDKRVSCTAAMTYKSCPPFDAVETGADYGTNLYTKIAGIPFDIDVVGAPAYSDDVTVKLVDASGQDACNGATELINLGTSPFNDGRKTYAITYNESVAKAQVEIIDNHGVCYPSTDTFSIRPAYFDISFPAMASLGSDPKLKAGVNFTIKAIAKNSGNTKTTAYIGTPQLDSRFIKDWTGQSLATPPEAFLSGSFNQASSGEAVGLTFTYSDIGILSFPAYNDAELNSLGSAVADNQFTLASGDQSGDCVIDSYSIVPDADGKYGCNIGSLAAASPRFTPDHYEVEYEFSYRAGCGGFDYLGQEPVAPPKVIIKAANVAGGQMVRLRSDYPFHPGNPSYPGDSSHKPVFTISALDNSGEIASPATSAPVSMALTTPLDWPSPSPDANNLDAIDGGLYQNFDTGLIAKPASKVAYSNFALKTTITDGDNIKITKCNNVDITPSSDSCTSPTTNYHYGILKLDNAYGSELLPLYVPVTAMYWDGTSWVKNTADSCTTLTTTGDATGNLSIGNFKDTLTRSNITLGTSAITLNAGTGSIRIVAPGAGVQGSADIALNLGLPAATSDASCLTWETGGNAPNATVGADLSHLRNTWCGGADKDPHARINFGNAKSPLLYKRLH